MAISDRLGKCTQHEGVTPAGIMNRRMQQWRAASSGPSSLVSEVPFVEVFMRSVCLECFWKGVAHTTPLSSAILNLTWPYCQESVVAMLAKERIKSSKLGNQPVWPSPDQSGSAVR